MSNSFIFENLLWNKTLTATFPPSFRKYFRCLKLYSKLIGKANFTGAHLEFIKGSGLNFSEIVANLLQG